MKHSLQAAMTIEMHGTGSSVRQVPEKKGTSVRILLACAAFPPYGKGGEPASSRLMASGPAHQGHEVRVVTVASGETLKARAGLEVKTISSPNVYWTTGLPIRGGRKSCGMSWRTEIRTRCSGCVARFASSRRRSW